jgi:hypothetical protein
VQFFADIGSSLRCGGLLVLGGAVKAGRVGAHGVPVNMHRSLPRTGRASTMPGIFRKGKKRLIETGHPLTDEILREAHFFRLSEVEPDSLSFE